MTDLLRRFQDYNFQENLFQQKDGLLIAVSGGVDSVVLCELCDRAGFDFALAHCNFQLRGAESDHDENFVKQLADKYQKFFFVKKFDTEKYANEKKISVQVAARELRYKWFGEIVNTGWSMVNGAHYSPSAICHIVTAHHLDDNIETVLMNFFKGTGIAGLRGILPKQGKIIRPLLFATKEEIKKFAVENNLQWVEDSSNESDKYSRNYFRHHLIPLIEKIYPSALNNLANNIHRFRDIEILYKQSIDRHKKNLIEQKRNEIHIPILKLKKSGPMTTIIYEIIKEYQFSPHQVDEVIHFLEGESGKYIQSPTHRIIKNRKWLVISPNNLQEATHIVIDEPSGQLRVDGGCFQFEIVAASSHKLQATNKIAQLDADNIKFPLLLRKWKQGDYFYPLGMKKKKKLSRFFIDSKLSKTEKEKTWVIEMRKKIIWVVDMRIDERFKITQQTKNILLISFSK